MIITTKSGAAIDTDSDLTAAERHILQKLFIWETMASSVEDFRKRVNDALQRGWNESGPVDQRAVLKAIIEEMEDKVRVRLGEKERD